ncbi:glycosyltransferase family 2 protein [Flavihumibacter sp. CACIAM 22H1]|uniref:glycosyltransferase family 2 protein n=1 Tax=Flavihumibacter sp. CACIAM 22H1 TaxID=1812911 RepID=UPI0007A88959|nr:glycosyltransferase family 2 protein [Flavihumibacter sp. CACIAM 22H1]KYP15972.1 MAG: hypothetical protein A1D16_06840 [Flavihumibacter sp. CACIAM 22H1]
MEKRINGVALVISTYNWPSALELVLETVLRQTRQPDEILIADDGSYDATRQLIQHYQAVYQLPLKHIWQPDKGFRKSLILNKAIRQTNCEYIIQIDGDILLHPNFIADHITAARTGCFIQGSRVLLNAPLTRKMIQTGLLPLRPWTKGIRNRINAIHFPLLRFLFNRKSGSNQNIKACNLAFWRADYIRVNGYNNEFFGWGWEDVEFATRLLQAGCKKRRLKMAAVAFHLHHNTATRNNLQQNETRFIETTKNPHWVCRNGYIQAS